MPFYQTAKKRSRAFSPCMKRKGGKAPPSIAMVFFFISVFSNLGNAEEYRALQSSTNGRPTLVESSPCIPQSEIRTIHLDPNDNRLPLASAGAQVQTQCYNQINSCGSSDLTAPSACCRVSYDAGWLVCDAFNAFDHMPCVCNDNTSLSPTPEPTTPPPTIELPATSQPTMNPTIEPTKEPTNEPTNVPTNVPTDSTLAPTTKEPTNEPTSSPVLVTSPPTVSPTLTPTASTDAPTKGPTNSPTVATESPSTKEPTDSPVAVTDSPTISATQAPTSKPTDLPTMSPTTSTAPSPKPTLSKFFTTENKFDSDLDANIRQSQCKETPPVMDFLQGSTFAYRYEVVVEEGVNVERLVGTLTDQFHDEMSRELMVCNSDGDEAYKYDTIWILQSKPHKVSYASKCGSGTGTVSANGQEIEIVESDSNDSGAGDNPNCFVIEAESRIIAYQSPLGKKATRQVWSETEYDTGPVSEQFANDAINFLDSFTSGEVLSENELVVGTSFQGGDIIAQTIEEEGETNETGDETTDTNTSSWADNFPVDENGIPIGTAVGIEGSVDSNENQNTGLTPGIIIGIAVVAVVVVLIILMGIGRRRRLKEGPREDEEYLRDVERNQSGSLHYAMGAVHHLDLSDSDDGDMNEPGPIVRSELDLEDAEIGGGSSPKGNIFNFSGALGSPSSRQRSKMGPLRATDEFLDGQSVATTKTDGKKGSHRGTPSSSSPPLPPNLITSPRTYALRDTIKL